MNLQTQELLAASAIVGAIQENPPLDPTRKDPMIAWNLEIWQYVGLIALSLAAIALVGFFSRKAEYAIMTAATLSLILIVFFLTLK